MIYIKHMEVIYEEPSFTFHLDHPFAFNRDVYIDLKVEMTGPTDEIQALALKIHEWYKNPGGYQNNNPWPKPEPEPEPGETEMDKLPEDSPTRLEEGTKELLQLPPGPK